MNNANSIKIHKNDRNADDTLGVAVILLYGRETE